MVAANKRPAASTHGRDNKKSRYVSLCLSLVYSNSTASTNGGDPVAPTPTPVVVVAVSTDPKDQTVVEGTDQRLNEAQVLDPAITGVSATEPVDETPDITSEVDANGFEGNTDEIAQGHESDGEVAAGNTSDVDDGPTTGVRYLISYF